MNRLAMALAVASTAVLAACGSSEVVVQAQIEEEGTVQPLSNMQVRALPYDRDAIFDSLGAAYGTPEPQIPAELAALQDSIAEANQAWTSATARWNVGRDSLQKISERLEGLNRASGEYVVLFRQSGALFDEVEAQERAMNEAFARFEALQQRYSSRAEEIQITREQWASAAYSDFDAVAAAHTAETGLEAVVDTTDANGMVTLTGLKSGEQYWIQARHDLPYEELYWNIPITTGSDPVRVELTRATAEVRPKL